MNRILKNALIGAMAADTYRQLHDVIADMAVAWGSTIYGFHFMPDGPELGEPGFTGYEWNCYPDRWKDIYANRAYHDIDPLYRFASQREGILRWSKATIRSGRQHEMMAAAWDHGLQDGLVAAINDGEGGRIQMSFVGTKGDIDVATAEHVLTVMLPVLALRFGAAHAIEAAMPKLTARQRDVYVFWKRSMPRKEIAARLNVSERTVYRHIENIRDRLAA